MDSDTALEQEINAILAEGGEGGDGGAGTPNTGASGDGKPAGDVTSSGDEKGAPTITLPPELLEQGSTLAKLAQQYLGSNAAALKAITDKLATPASPQETPDEQKARVDAALADFFKDPEKFAAKYIKPTEPTKINKDEVLQPVYETRGENRVSGYLKDMRESDDLALTKEAAKEIEDNFWAVVNGMSWNGSFESTIGSLDKKDASTILSNIYHAAVGKKAFADMKAAAKSKPSNVSGSGGGGRSVSGMQSDVLKYAEAAARGAATDETGKFDEKQYKEILKIALGGS